MRNTQALRGVLSPLWHGARGGEYHDIRGLGFPPTLSLLHKGGGDAVARPVPSIEGRRSPWSSEKEDRRRDAVS